VQGPAGAKKRDWSKIVLAIYFVLFLAFIYAPLLLMGVLSLQGEFGSITFPFKGPLSLDWWRTIVDESLPGSNARARRSTSSCSR
jgi:putative spermidine/putrescine transport system permease protein